MSSVCLSVVRWLVRDEWSEMCCEMRAVRWVVWDEWCVHGWCEVNGLRWLVRYELCETGAVRCVVWDGWCVMSGVRWVSYEIWDGRIEMYSMRWVVWWVVGDECGEELLVDDELFEMFGGRILGNFDYVKRNCGRTGDDPRNRCFSYRSLRSMVFYVFFFRNICYFLKS